MIGIGMMARRRGVLLLAIVAGTHVACVAGGAGATDSLIGDRRGAAAQELRSYLLLDRRNVQDAGGAQLVLGPVTKRYGGPVHRAQSAHMHCTAH